MKQYRFVGTETEIGPVKLDRFGQRIELEDELALNAQRGGCAIVSEAEFQTFGFTHEDLKIWADPFVDPFEVPSVEAEARSKARFLELQRAVRESFVQLRQRLSLQRANQTTQDAAHGETLEAVNETNEE